MEMPMPLRLKSPFSFKAAFPVLAVFILAAVCATAEPLERRLPFVTSRGGDVIGPHIITITKDGDTTTVKISSRFIVKIAFVTVYRFEHDSTEVWHKGNFWSLQAVSNDNGTHFQLKGHAEYGKFIVDGLKDGKPFREEVPGDMASASLWGTEMAHGTALLNTLTGLPVKVEIKDLGQEPTPVHGVQTNAHHFQITGELVQDDWYDKDGYLVRKLAKGPGGTDVDFLLP